MEKTKHLNEYPDYIVAAVEWWADELSREKESTNLISYIRNLFADSIGIDAMDSFQDTLATQIQKDLSDYEYSEVYISDTGPCYSLLCASEKAGIKKHLDRKKECIEMIITKSEVLVSSGKARYKTVWSFIH